MTKAVVETWWAKGQPKALRDEYGGRWRVAADNGDGTMAVELVSNTPENPWEAETLGMTPCAVAAVYGGKYFIYPCMSHGENYTDPSEYYIGHDTIVATSGGWDEK